MKKEIIQIILKVAIYALGLIAAYFGVTSLASCSTSHDVSVRGRTTIDNYSQKDISETERKYHTE